MDFLFREDFPIARVGSLTVATQDLSAKREAWALEAFEYLSDIRLRIEHLRAQTANPKLLSLARSRLKKMTEHYQFHLQQTTSQLAFLTNARIHSTEYSRKMDPRPHSSYLSQYHSHLGKDWAWGEEEIQSALKWISECVPKMSSPQKMLALGAGACRLPYELHQMFSIKDSYLLDINPLLLSIAQKVIQGEEIEVIDFPLVPLDANSFTVKSKLKCKIPVKEGLHFVVHDVLEWGFKGQIFDLVFTPWFIDISPIHAPDQFALINSSLKMGGEWLNYGPLIFNQGDLDKYYSYEEVLYLVEKSGFEILEKRYVPVPHLKNPHSGRWQQDHVLVFNARKVAECEKPHFQAALDQPDWLVDHDLKITLPQSLTEMQLSLGFTLDLAMNCQKGLSIRELSKVLAHRHQMPLEQVEFLVASTLKLWTKRT